MDAQICLQLLRDIKDVAFATVDEQGRPQVRIIDIMLVEDDRLYFVTARGKAFHRQVEARGEVAVTGMTHDWRMVRLSGKVRQETDPVWLERVFASNPGMNDLYPGDSRFILDVFCIWQGHGELLSLERTPIERHSFCFGGDQGRDAGYVITEACAGCGLCAENCPQRCIAPGSPFVIEQRHCLHCGRCAEICPFDAVRERGNG